MRSMFFFSGALVAACGGGGSDNRPDAKIFLDAAVDATPMCSVVCESHICSGMNGAPPPNSTMFPGLILAMGRDANMVPIPVSDDWFIHPTMGTFMGRTVLSVGARTTPQGATTPDIFVIEVLKPMAGGFPLNNPISLSTGLNAGATTATAIAYWLGNFDTTTRMEEAFYVADDGTITLTAAGETDGAAVTTKASAINLTEVDQQGMPAASGCKVSIGGLETFGTQKDDPAQPFQPTSGLKFYPLTEGEKAAVASRLETYRARAAAKH